MAGQRLTAPHGAIGVDPAAQPDAAGADCQRSEAYPEQSSGAGYGQLGNELYQRDRGGEQAQRGALPGQEGSLVGEGETVVGLLLFDDVFGGTIGSHGAHRRFGRVLKALLFDVQGTATDFHSTVCDEARRISAGRDTGVHWPEMVRRWRAGYFAALENRSGQGPWLSVHSVYRDVLDTVLTEAGFTHLTAAERDDLALAWQRLRPWPDVVPGLTRLRRTYVLATLSNADVSAVITMSKRAGLPWDAIFTAEMAGVFKPDPAAYRMAATYLGLPAGEIMMVASHKYDLRAAARLGFQTAFVARPLEFGADGVADVAYSDEFDVNACDFVDLADQLVG